MTTSPSDRRRRGGFTLIEVMLVLVILVIIGSLAVGIYMPYKEEADIKAARYQVDAFKSPLGLYQLQMDNYPSRLEDLWIRPTDVANPNKWNGPYFDEIYNDPWKQPYQYELYTDQNNRIQYRIWSFGPDQIDGTEDDISNLDQQENRP